MRAKADPAEVARACREAKAEAVTRFGLRTVPTETPSLDRARTLYAQSCLPCHGATGDAATAQAALLDPRPASFREPARLAALSPYRVYNTLTFGVPGTGMASFESLSPSDRWALAFYVLRLGHEGEPARAGRGHEPGRPGRAHRSRDPRVPARRRRRGSAAGARPRAHGSRVPGAAGQPRPRAHARHAARRARLLRGGPRARGGPAGDGRLPRRVRAAGAAAARARRGGDLGRGDGLPRPARGPAAGRRPRRARHRTRARSGPGGSGQGPPAAARAHAGRVPHLLPRGGRGRAARGRAAGGSAPARPRRCHPLRAPGLGGRPARRRPDLVAGQPRPGREGGRPRALGSGDRPGGGGGALLDELLDDLQGRVAPLDGLPAQGAGGEPHPPQPRPPRRPFLPRRLPRGGGDRALHPGPAPRSPRPVRRGVGGRGGRAVRGARPGRADEPDGRAACPSGRSSPSPAR